MPVDTTVHRPPRFSWPKILPPLTPEQTAISDDFMRHWHEVLPLKYNIVEEFNHGYPLKYLPEQSRWRTIEIGAGIGGHLALEDLSRQDYHCVEFRDNMASEIKRRYPDVTVVVGDCEKKLPYPDAHFDRAIAIHVLEHLPNLPAAINELHRVLKAGAIFSIVIPCDPGIAYEFARKISSERIFKKRYKLPFKWFIRREHINSPTEILSLLKAGFVTLNRTYFPLKIPVVSANICIGATFRRL